MMHEISCPTISDLGDQSIYFKKNYHYLSLLYIIIIGINELTIVLYVFHWKINIKYNIKHVHKLNTKY